MEAVPRRYLVAGTVALGLLTAVLVSLVTGVLLTAFGLSLEGAAEQIFEGVAMLLAATFMRCDCALSAEPAISKMLNKDIACGSL